MLDAMEQNPNHGDKRRHLLLYAWLILMVFLLVLTLALFDRIVSSVEESGMVGLVKEYLEKQKTAESSPHAGQSPVQLVFAIPRQGGFFSFRYYPSFYTGDLYHGTIEALLNGPTKDALAEGAVSCIPADTRLIGLTVSSQIVYVDLSKDFLSSTVWEQAGHDGASTQITRTLKALNGIRDAVILIEGVPLAPIN